MICCTFQIISLTSNFGEEAVTFETTTITQKESIGTSSASTTEFTPSPTHIINFDFDGEGEHQHGNILKSVCSCKLLVEFRSLMFR